MKKFLSVLLALWGILGVGNWVLSGCQVSTSSFGLGQMVGTTLCGVFLICGICGLMSNK